MKTTQSGWKKELSESIRKQCDKLSFRQRKNLIICLFTVYGISSLYVLIDAINRIGNSDKENKIIVEKHIEALPIPGDSVQHLKFNQNGTNNE